MKHIKEKKEVTEQELIRLQENNREAFDKEQEIRKEIRTKQESLIDLIISIEQKDLTVENNFVKLPLADYENLLRTMQEIQALKSESDILEYHSLGPDYIMIKKIEKLQGR
jgi:hypothetical protein